MNLRKISSFTRNYYLSLNSKIISKRYINNLNKKSYDCHTLLDKSPTREFDNFINYSRPKIMLDDFSIPNYRTFKHY